MNGLQNQPEFEKFCLRECHTKSVTSGKNPEISKRQRRNLQTLSDLVVIEFKHISGNSSDYS